MDIQPSSSSHWPLSGLRVDRYLDPRSEIRWQGEPPRFDWLVASVGYEQRSSFVAQELVGHYATCCTWAFEDHRELSFEENLAFYRSIGATILQESEEAFAKSLHLQCLDLLPGVGTRRLQVAADISSMTRQRIAHLLRSLLVEVPLASGRAVELTLLYAPAEFTRDVGSEGPIRVSEPVKGFEGWTLEPSRPTACVIGLGFEHQLAIAAIEQLEPADIWLLMPEGVDPRYDETLRQANYALLQEVPPAQVLAYDVNAPYVTYLKLLSLVQDLSERMRPVVVPLGPKLLAGVAMTVALARDPDVAVWRLSADVARTAQERRPAGSIVGLHLATDHPLPAAAD